jgi:Spy/CpxP family protein refolding chaperone
MRFIAALAFGLAASVAHAQPSPRPEGGDDPGPQALEPQRPQGIAGELGLSETQREKVREILDDQRSQREALFEKMSANREALRQLLESGSADANAVGELVLEGRKLHEESRALREAEQKAIRSILNAEQQKKFDSLQGRRRERGPGRVPEGWPTSPPGAPRARGTRGPLGTPNPGQLPPLQ